MANKKNKKFQKGNRVRSTGNNVEGNPQDQLWQLKNGVEGTGTTPNDSDEFGFDENTSMGSREIRTTPMVSQRAVGAGRYDNIVPPPATTQSQDTVIPDSIKFANQCNDFFGNFQCGGDTPICSSCCYIGFGNSVACKSFCDASTAGTSQAAQECVGTGGGLNLNGHYKHNKSCHDHGLSNAEAESDDPNVQCPVGQMLDFDQASDGLQFGCTDPDACNYRQQSDIDDGSCIYLTDLQDGDPLICDCAGTKNYGCGNPGCNNIMPEGCDNCCSNVSNCSDPPLVTDVCGVCGGDGTSCDDCLQDFNLPCGTPTDGQGTGCSNLPMTCGPNNSDTCCDCAGNEDLGCGCGGGIPTGCGNDGCDSKNNSGCCDNDVPDDCGVCGGGIIIGTNPKSVDNTGAIVNGDPCIPTNMDSPCGFKNDAAGIPFSVVYRLDCNGNCTCEGSVCPGYDIDTCGSCKNSSLEDVGPCDCVFSGDANAGQEGFGPDKHCCCCDAGTDTNDNNIKDCYDPCIDNGGNIAFYDCAHNCEYVPDNNGNMISNPEYGYKTDECGVCNPPNHDAIITCDEFGGPGENFNYNAYYSDVIVGNKKPCECNSTQYCDRCGVCGGNSDCLNYCSNDNGGMVDCSQFSYSECPWFACKRHYDVQVNPDAEAMIKEAIAKLPSSSGIRNYGEDCFSDPSCWGRSTPPGYDDPGAYSCYIGIHAVANRYATADEPGFWSLDSTMSMPCSLSGVPWGNPACGDAGSSVYDNYWAIMDGGEPKLDHDYWSHPEYVDWQTRRYGMCSKPLPTWGGHQCDFAMISEPTQPPYDRNSPGAKNLCEKINQYPNWDLPFYCAEMSENNYGYLSYSDYAVAYSDDTTCPNKQSILDNPTTCGGIWDNYTQDYMCNGWMRQYQGWELIGCADRSFDYGNDKSMYRPICLFDQIPGKVSAAQVEGSNIACFHIHDQECCPGGSGLPEFGQCYFQEVKECGDSLWNCGIATMHHVCENWPVNEFCHWMNPDYDEGQVIPGGEPETCVGQHLGDVNGDGGYNILDIVALAAGILGTIDKNNCTMDMNCDGGVNVLDLVSLANCVLSVNCSDLICNSTSESGSNLNYNSPAGIPVDWQNQYLEGLVSGQIDFVNLHGVLCQGAPIAGAEDFCNIPLQNLQPDALNFHSEFKQKLIDDANWYDANGDITELPTSLNGTGVYFRKPSGGLTNWCLENPFSPQCRGRRPSDMLIRETGGRVSRTTPMVSQRAVGAGRYEKITGTGKSKINPNIKPGGPGAGNRSQNTCFDFSGEEFRCDEGEVCSSCCFIGFGGANMSCNSFCDDGSGPTGLNANICNTDIGIDPNNGMYTYGMACPGHGHDTVDELQYHNCPAPSGAPPDDWGLDLDSDGIWDTVDDCNGTWTDCPDKGWQSVEDMGNICPGNPVVQFCPDGNPESAILEFCPTYDAIGVCDGDCASDTDQDGVCDDVDDCVGEYDGCGVCNGDAPPNPECCDATVATDCSAPDVNACSGDYTCYCQDFSSGTMVEPDCAGICLGNNLINDCGDCTEDGWCEDSDGDNICDCVDDCVCSDYPDNGGYDNCGECCGNNTLCCNGMGVATSDCGGDPSLWGDPCGCNCFDNMNNGVGIPGAPCGSMCSEVFDDCSVCAGPDACDCGNGTEACDCCDFSDFDNDGIHDDYDDCNGNYRDICGNCCFESVTDTLGYCPISPPHGQATLDSNGVCEIGNGGWSHVDQQYTWHGCDGAPVRHYKYDACGICNGAGISCGDTDFRNHKCCDDRCINGKQYDIGDLGPGYNPEVITCSMWWNWEELIPTFGNYTGPFTNDPWNNIQTWVHGVATQGACNNCGAGTSGIDPGDYTGLTDCLYGCDGFTTDSYEANAECSNQLPGSWCCSNANYARGYCRCPGKCTIAARPPHGTNIERKKGGRTGGMRQYNKGGTTNSNQCPPGYSLGADGSCNMG